MKLQLDFCEHICFILVPSTKYKQFAESEIGKHLRNPDLGSLFMERINQKVGVMQTDHIQEISHAMVLGPNNTHSGSS